VLQARHDELLATVTTRALDDIQIDPYLESGFRLAVLPETSPQEALALLSLCRRLDPLNPRYAFHTARLYFAAGELDAAREWLRAAYRLSPTSHRIWAHIVQLQWAVNQQVEGDSRFDTLALRDCADGIIAAIRSGQDTLAPEFLQLTPVESAGEKVRVEKERKAQRGRGSAEPDRRAREPATPAPSASRLATPRIAGERACRWSGIDHLVLERMLAGKCSQQTVDMALPLLEQIARDARRRRGGVAGFVTLAVEWLILGYPPETIRRLLPVVGAGTKPTSPSLELAEIVVRCFELPPSEVPAELVLGLVVGKLPVALAAMIHRRRALHAPIVFSAVREYRAARTLIGRPDPDADAKDRDLAMLDATRRLDRALTEHDGAPAAPLEDRATTGSAVPAGGAAVGSAAIMSELWEL
jgi:hypothetical protein